MKGVCVRSIVPVPEQGVAAYLNDGDGMGWDGIDYGFMVCVYVCV